MNVNMSYTYTGMHLWVFIDFICETIYTLHVKANWLRGPYSIINLSGTTISLSADKS